MRGGSQSPRRRSSRRGALSNSNAYRTHAHARTEAPPRRTGSALLRLASLGMVALASAGKGKDKGKGKGAAGDSGSRPAAPGGGLAERDVRAVVERETADARSVMAQFRQQTADVRAQLAAAREELGAGARPTAAGVSYLELKLQLLLSYCSHLAFYLVLKAEGAAVAGHPVIEKLVETRTYMEKLRPLDAKLKYQMDKLLKTAASGTGAGEDAAAADALKFRPNPGALQLPDFGASGGGGGDDDDDGGGTAARAGGDGEDDPDAKPGVYRPPKINAMHFEDRAEAKKRREREKTARKASKSDIVMALREEFDDAPMEESHHVRNLADDDEIKHRTRYEEDNFLRLNVTKADKKRFREKMKDSALSSFDEFRDLAMPETAADDDEASAKVLKKRCPPQCECSPGSRCSV